MWDQLSEQVSDEWKKRVIDILRSTSEIDAADILECCSMDGMTYIASGEYIIYLTVPDDAIPILRNPEHRVTKSIRRAFEIYSGGGFSHFNLQGGDIPMSNDLYNRLPDLIRKGGIHNQGLGKEIPQIWQGLRFRSASEAEVAIALDKLGILYLPNCRMRLNSPKGGRETREPDFLVCIDGKWGILEVDGKESHNDRYVQDQERDRIFKMNGIRVIEHFDSMQCNKDSHNVVKQFTEILRKS